MAFSDLCHIGNAYKTVENESDLSEHIMEENSLVRDLITKILDETGPTEGSSSTTSSEKAISTLPTSASQLPKNDTNNSFIPPYSYPNGMFNYGQGENGYNFMHSGFSGSNFVNYNDNDVNTLLGIDPVTDSISDVTPEQLNLLRLAAQEIGGAQFSNPKFDEKYYNFFEQSQRNSLPDSNMFPINNFNRPHSLNLDMNYNNFEAPFNAQRFPNKFEGYKDASQESDLMGYINNLNLSDRPREENAMQNNMDFKLQMDNGHYQNEEFNKMQDKMFYNRNFQQMPPKNYNEFYDMMSQNQMGQNFDYSKQATPVSGANTINFKPNGFQQNEFMQRRDMNQMMPRDFQMNGCMNEQRNNFENPMARDQAMMRQNQEIARQMSLLMRSRPPPNQLNVDVSFLHENTPFNLGLGALLGPSPVPPPVLPSPMLEVPLLTPFYVMRNMRTPATPSSILHARLDVCYEQWRQLERERKRTEARLALAYPGRAVSSSNNIPVPRLPPCPTRVDRLTVDMLREHTKVLTLMAKMETLRSSLNGSFNKKLKIEDPKITVLKRGQENVASDKEKGENTGLDPASFEPASWREDVKNLPETGPHSEVESAMLAWRSAVGAVQAARRREVASHAARYVRQDPILQLAEAVKQLSVCARRARCAMWCDLTLTVALAPTQQGENSSQPSPVQSAPSKLVTENATNNSNQTISKQKTPEAKEEKPATESLKPDVKNEKPPINKQPENKPEKNNQRRNNYRKANNRNDFYQKNQRYDHRFMHNRHPYHYLATGPIN